MLAGASLPLCRAQDLAPRAYLVTPLHASAVNLTYSFFTGGINFNGVVPITDATGTYSVPILSVYHSFSVFKRSANVAAFLPYGVGKFQGDVSGSKQEVYRSGLLDTGVRFSVNLKGGPAMTVPQFMRWRQKTVLGASLRVIAPTGQYDPTKIVNWGIHRWGFKPELGYSQALKGKWILDAYGGAWFFTQNREFFSVPVPQPQTQSPIASFETHLSYNARTFPGRGAPLWFSVDGNFWHGGTTTLAGTRNSGSRQTNSRVGVTAAVPITRHQGLKASFSTGDYVRFGGNYQNVSVSWQYSWLGTPN